MRARESAQWVEGTRSVVCSLAGGGVPVLRTAPPPSASTLVLSARPPLAMERPSRRMSDHSNRTNRDVLHNHACATLTQDVEHPARRRPSHAPVRRRTRARQRVGKAKRVQAARPRQPALCPPPDPRRPRIDWPVISTSSVTAGPRARAVAFGSRALFFFHVSWTLPPRQIPARDPQVARPSRTWSHSKTRPHVAWPGATRSDGKTRGWGAALNLGASRECIGRSNSCAAQRDGSLRSTPLYSTSR